MAYGEEWSNVLLAGAHLDETGRNVGSQGLIQERGLQHPRQRLCVPLCPDTIQVATLRSKTRVQRCECPDTNQQPTWSMVV